MAELFGWRVRVGMTEKGPANWQQVVRIKNRETAEYAALDIISEGEGIPLSELILRGSEALECGS